MFETIIFEDLVEYGRENLETIHYFIEGALFLFILFLFFQKPTKRQTEKMKPHHEKILLDDFEPEPLAPSLSTRHKFDLQSLVTFDKGISFPKGKINGKEVQNLSSWNYLGFSVDPLYQENVIKTVKKYGTGSCGPRAFLGTVDVHLDLEKNLKEFLQTEDCIIYSSQYSVVVSFVMSVARRHDILVMDRGVKHAIKLGADLSRAKVLFFDHNDMSQLEDIWKSLEHDRKTKKIPFSTRFWLLVEGLYENSGSILPLPQILELKRKYCFRVMLEETHSFGVLGPNGRGVCEHYGVPTSSVECIVGGMNTSLASDGGFCAGEAELVSFQRLNGSGYVFSASLPPCVTVGGSTSLQLLQEKTPQILQRLRHIIKSFHAQLEPLKPYFEIHGDPLSPIFHLRLKNSVDGDLEDDKLLQSMCDRALNRGVFVVRGKYIDEWEGRPPPSIKICLNALLTDPEIQTTTQILADSAFETFSEH